MRSEGLLGDFDNSVNSRRGKYMVTKQNKKKQTGQVSESTKAASQKKRKVEAQEVLYITRV
jgi:hypothetical protein